jgi:hypothetical protein
LQKLVFKEFLDCGALIGVLLQTSSNEVLERLGKLALESRRGVLGDQEENTHRMQISIRRLLFGQLNGSDTHGPNISLGVITGLLDNFRGHPEWCSDESVSLGSLVSQLTGYSEIGKLHVSVSSEENVGG